MRLIRIEIENFGKLSTFLYDFEEGANVICGPNGTGKSTLAAFIRVMFFGFGGERSRDPIINERRRYKPWQGGLYGGRLAFSAGKKRYEITRTFGQKESEDTFILRDYDTNMISHDYSTRIGEELFGIDGGSFMRTVFLSQQDCETGVNGDISAKIGNLVDDTDDINNYEVAMERLKNYQNNMSPKRATGSLYRKRQQLEELKTKTRMMETIENSAVKEATMLAEKKILEYEIMKEKEQLKSRRQMVSSFKDTQSKRTTYMTLCENLEDKERELALVANRFPNPERIPDEESINNVYNLYDRMNKQEAELSKQKAVNARISGEIDARKASYEALLAETFDNPGKQDYSIKIALAAMGIFLMLAGAVMFLFKLALVGFILLGAGVLAIILALLVKGKSRSGIDESALFDIKHQIESESAKLSTLEAQLRIQTTECDTYYSQILDFIHLYYGEIDEGTDIATVLSDIKKNAGEYALYADQVAEALEKVNEFERRENTAGLLEIDEEQMKSSSLKEMDDQLSTLELRLSKVKESIWAHEEALRELEGKKEELSECVAMYEQLDEKIQEELKKYELVSRAGDFLKDAKYSFGIKYAQPLLKAFREYYEEMTGLSADDYRMDAQSVISIMEQGTQRDIRNLSNGCQDMIGICMRLALVKAMYQEESPFLVMDDPFVNLDSDRLSTSLEFLEKVAEEYQIIYMTCHESRAI